MATGASQSPVTEDLPPKPDSGGSLEFQEEDEETAQEIWSHEVKIPEVNRVLKRGSPVNDAISGENKINSTIENNRFSYPPNDTGYFERNSPSFFVRTIDVGSNMDIVGSNNELRFRSNVINCSGECSKEEPERPLKTLPVNIGLVKRQNLVSLNSRKHCSDSTLPGINSNDIHANLAVPLRKYRPCSTSVEKSSKSLESDTEEKFQLYSRANSKPQYNINSESYSSHKIRSFFSVLYHLRLRLVGCIFLLLTHCSPSLGFCPSGCLCDNVQLAVKCLSGRVDVVPILLNPGTVHLDLSHNRIKTILPGFAFYHELKVLNVSFNEIVALGESNFVSQVALSVLVLKNNKISKLDDRAFVGLSSLQELDASNNYIDFIHSNTFRSVSALRKINLAGNRIRTLNLNVFQNLTKLKILDLCKNLLTEIPSKLFDPLINLKELFLCSNEIVTLHDASFTALKQLSFLSLQSNKIGSISEGAFKGLESLEELSLYGNQLTSVPSSQMRVFSALQDLNLSLNLISFIPPNSFDSLTRLKSLSISQCSALSRIDLKAFDTLSSLTSLELNFSPLLVDFEIEMLRPLSELRRLILRGNGITTLSKDLLGIGHLQYIDLRDNNFDCECSLKWIQDARQNESLNIQIEDVLCAAPEALKGRSISALTEYDLKCYGHIITITISASVTLAILLLLAVAFMIYYKNCRKMKTLVHDNWPDKIVTTWRETDYQKQVEDDEYTFHSLRGIHHIPVTVI